ncbi:MAG: helix-turn-helix domain-containing protein [Zoogloeaceae bacterium]|jgi:DNA-binding transcriptional ArsR family regulator|nr:helix-turn-helix domain-containing protein [Zoogloeaceae bacterium]
MESNEYKADLMQLYQLYNMIDSDDFILIPGNAIKIYLVIKRYSNKNDGTSFPSIKKITEKTGLSEDQINRLLKILIEKEYIKKERYGRSNNYKLIEKVSIRDKISDTQVAVAKYEYSTNPVHRNAAFAEIEKAILSELTETVIQQLKIVKIERIEQLNVQINLAENNQQNVMNSEGKNVK